MRRALIPTVLVAALLGTGCNTIAGVGEDFSALGRAITGQSEDSRGDARTRSDDELDGGPGSTRR
jgi:predicted small secreted protein